MGATPEPLSQARSPLEEAQRHFPGVLSVGEASGGAHLASTPEARKRESWQSERAACGVMA